MNISAKNVVDLCRHVRNSSKDNMHPWCMHIVDDKDFYVSDFMKMCSQVNCIYPLKTDTKDKKNIISSYLL